MKELKASELLRSVEVAARDLDRKKYRPFWAQWHKPTVHPYPHPVEPCLICFAGVWLTNFFKPTQHIELYDLLPIQAGVVKFLDGIRDGEFADMESYALLARIEDPVGLQHTLEEWRESYQIPELLDEWRKFTTWDAFEHFLNGVSELADMLDEKGL